MLDQIARQTVEVAALMNHFSDKLDAPPCIACDHGGGQLIKNPALRQAKDILQHGLIDRRDVSRVRRSLRTSKHLLQQRLGIAHAAISLAPDQRQSTVGDAKAFTSRDLSQAFDDFPQTDSAKIITLASRKNRFRQTMRFGCRENKLYRRRRLFQCFEQCIKGVFGDLMHFIDDVNFKATFSRLIADIFDDLTNFIDAPIRRAIDLKNVYRDALGNLLAMRAMVTGSRRRPLLTVQCLCENPCCRGFSDTAHPGKEIGMGDAIRPYGVLQRAGNGLLAGNIRKTLRPPFSRDHKIGHILQRTKESRRLCRPVTVNKRTVYEMPIADSQVTLWHRSVSGTAASFRT